MVLCVVICAQMSSSGVMKGQEIQHFVVMLVFQQWIISFVQIIHFGKI